MYSNEKESLWRLGTLSQKALRGILPFEPTILIKLGVKFVAVALLPFSQTNDSPQASHRHQNIHHSIYSVLSKSKTQNDAINTNI